LNLFFFSFQKTFKNMSYGFSLDPSTPGGSSSSSNVGTPQSAYNKYVILNLPTQPKSSVVSL